MLVTLNRLLALTLTLGCLGPAAMATTVQHCKSPDGHITFTSLGCPQGHSLLSEKYLKPSFDSGSSVSLMLLPPAEYSSTQHYERSEATLLVVGGREDGCGNRLNRSERRQAIIQRQTRPGMTIADVESALGKPDTITERNGEKQYLYKNRNGTTRVTFDSAECVKGKN